MNKIVFKIIIFCIICLNMSPSSSWAAAEVEVNFEFARNGDNILAGITIDIPEEYHAYANKPGKVGLPTTLEFTLEGEGKMPVDYPEGVEQKDIFDPAAEVNVYKGQVMLLAVLPQSASGSLYAATLDMLLCSTRHCLPSKQSFSGYVPKNMPLLSETSWRYIALELLDREGESLGAISLEEGKKPVPILDPVENRTDQNVKKEVNGNSSTLKNTIPLNEDFNLSLNPQYGNTDLEIYSLGKALLMGLLAGILLNVMPCVLPVLTMKVTGLLLIGSDGKRDRLRRFREHNLCFAAGVLTFFTLLAFVLGAADLMWGQLYQNQTILLVMLMLVFLMGLSMLGVFTLPALDLRIGENTKNPMLKAYLTGFISTFLATPCSGPLLGGVLAWAFTQKLIILLVIFWSVGLGMAFPYILLTIWPNMAKMLPKPGNWMYIFEHLLGFLLLGTAIYLFSILPVDKHILILIALLFVGAGAWLWGKFCGLDAPRTRRKIAGFFAIGALCGSIYWILSPPAPEPEWHNFTPKEFAEDFGKKNMLVEFTADWCPNCKVLEATVLTGNDLRKWQKNYDLELVKVDLTDPDPYAQKLLDLLGSKSIPLTAIFAKGDKAYKPLVLRDIYGKQTLDRALNAVLAGT